jgi:hypothetical protein
LLYSDLIDSTLSLAGSPNEIEIISGLCTSVQALAAAMQIDKSIETSFGILIQFGEELPRGMGDDTLQTDIDQMTYILQSTPDDSIYNIQENNNAKMTGLFHLYLYLAQALHFYQPWLFGSVSLRTMEITMKYGLCAMSPLAFARFGTLSVTIGYVTAGCRLGEWLWSFATHAYFTLVVLNLHHFTAGYYRKASTQTAGKERLIAIQIKSLFFCL